MRRYHFYLDSLGGCVVAESEVAHIPQHSGSASSLVVERCSGFESGWRETSVFLKFYIMII